MKGFLDSTNEEGLNLFTDLYELTMCASYFDNRKLELATYAVFIRRLPPGRKIAYAFPSLKEISDTAAANLFHLPQKYKNLTDPLQYPVELSQDLTHLTKILRKKITQTEILDKNSQKPQ
jgi:nicotinic acid phosphoribosyltransferase